jgi:hypothetical protein
MSGVKPSSIRKYFRIAAGEIGFPQFGSQYLFHFIQLLAIAKFSLSWILLNVLLKLVFAVSLIWPIEADR